MAISSTHRFPSLRSAAPRLRHCLAPVLSALALGAYAHTPYLLPTSFDIQPNETISVEASFTEKFFVPEVVFGETLFAITAPDGTQLPFGDIRQFKLRTIAEQKLPNAKGTYRLSTGPRLGAIFRSWERDGKTVVARDPKQVMPADAKLISHYQSLSVSEAYVTAGAPTRDALKPRGRGLEIVPVTHPSDLVTGEKFEFVVQHDGAPLPDQKVDIYRSAMDLSNQHSADSLKTDAQGKISYALAKPGIYLALIRHRATAPEGAAAPMYGYNYTLTFRVQTP
ncbi:DUF4198 domain-containing protein [Variovorax sp. VNK109]|uniref:DUF4198 domain-containing protein n=1 Tax=Variovorax sp. VNK109 TaxID=3400919 RepID=UPI003C1126E5